MIRNSMQHINLYTSRQIGKFYFGEYTDNFSDLNSNLFRLNHYKLQSKERWCNIVIPRGDADRNIPWENDHLNEKQILLGQWRDENTFHKQDLNRNEVEDLDLINQNQLIT